MPVTIDGTNGITNGGGYTGDGVSFADATPANTLVTTAGGNVGIGTNNPNFKLTVNGNLLNTYTNIAPGNTTSEFVGMSLSNPYTGGDGVSFIDSQGRNSVTDSHIFFIHQADYGSTITFGTQPAGTNTDRRVERMRITPNGNIAIGSGIANGRLHVQTADVADTIFVSANTGGTAANAVYVIPVRTAGTLRGGIQWNGTNLLYNNSSDARLKENIDDADDAASLVDAIQVRKFDWKETGFHQRYGFVAQELQGVFPEAVSGDPESEEATMAVDYSKLVPMLVKEIQSLRARLAAVEGAIA